MARIRTIKPEFWTSEQVADCSPTARLLFIGIWNFADDGGVHPYSLRRIKMEIFPADNFTLDQIQAWLNELLSSNLLKSYSVENERFLKVSGWKHQKIEKPSYKHPQPNENTIFSDYSPTVRRPLTDHQPADVDVDVDVDVYVEDKGITPSTTTAAEQIENVLTEKQERLKQLFPDKDIAVVGEKLINHYRDKPKLIDPWDITLKWFQKEFPQQAKQVISINSKLSQRELERQSILEANKQACRDFAGV